MLYLKLNRLEVWNRKLLNPKQKRKKKEPAVQERGQYSAFQKLDR